MSRAEQFRLDDEIDFYERSLADAKTEHDHGELDDETFEAIVARDSAKLVAAKAARAQLVPTDLAIEVATAPKRRGRRTWLLIVGISAIVLGAVVLLAGSLGLRLPGQQDTGSIAQNQNQRLVTLLAQGASEEKGGNLEAALTAFGQALALDPQQTDALAEAGWLQYEIGTAGANAALVDNGEQLVRRAVLLAPTGYAAHLYLGAIMLRAHHDPAAAVHEFKAFLSLNPPTSLRRVAAPYIRDAYGKMGLAAPPQARLAH